MTTYKFEELDKRGQKFAAINYCEDQAVIEMFEELKDSCDNDLSFRNVYGLLGFRFTEHGERIA